MSQMFVRGVAEIAEALVAFRRLQNFLEYEEKDGHFLEYMKLDLNGDSTQKNGKTPIEKIDPRIGVEMRNVTARWIPLSKREKEIAANEVTKSAADAKTANGHSNDSWMQPTLQNINVSFKRGSLIGIVGNVGSGKSSFLQALLHELAIEKGTISVNGSVSYASQEPWVFASSARQNILFGQEMDRDRYDAVVKACSLTKDYEQFENGDRTIIGERGTSLSGGQKARIKYGIFCYQETVKK